MEPRPVTLTLTLALAILLTATFPLPSFSLSSSASTISPPTSPPPPPPPPPPPLPPPPPPLPLTPPHPPPPPPPRTTLSAEPNDAQDPLGRRRRGPPPGPCRRGERAGCPWRWPQQHRGSGRPTREAMRHAARVGRGLNLGEKVGFSFLAAAVVLQLVFGGFLIYARWRIGKGAYEREVALSSPSASSSVN